VLVYEGYARMVVVRVGWWCVVSRGVAMASAVRPSATANAFGRRFVAPQQSTDERRRGVEESTFDQDNKWTIKNQCPSIDRCRRCLEDARV
jgi:hypothetical protein